MNALFFKIWQKKYENFPKMLHVQAVTNQTEESKKIKVSRDLEPYKIYSIKYLSSWGKKGTEVEKKAQKNDRFSWTKFGNLCKF